MGGGISALLWPSCVALLGCVKSGKWCGAVHVWPGVTGCDTCSITVHQSRDRAHPLVTMPIRLARHELQYHMPKRCLASAGFSDHVPTSRLCWQLRLRHTQSSWV